MHDGSTGIGQLNWSTIWLYVLRGQHSGIKCLLKVNQFRQRDGYANGYIVQSRKTLIVKRNDMGGRYCAINSTRGSRWGQKSRDRRSRNFCPHRGLSGELIAQYRPPMSFCFYPTLYLGNHLYFLKPDSS